jgi:hypothetical protein
MTNIELSTLIKEGFLYVLLKDKCFGSAILVITSTFQDRFNFLECKTHNYTVSSICQLSRFHNPNIIISILFTIFFSFIKSFQKNIVFLVIYTFFYMKW